MPNIKKYFLIFLLLELFFSYAPVYAQVNSVGDYTQGGKNPVSSQIEKYLCAPTAVTTSQTSLTNGAGILGQSGFQQYAASNNANAGDLYKCINQLYKFAIVVAAVVGVFFIVIAGYLYMSAGGNTESVDKAKSILESSIASLVILLSGYILLKAINPDIIQFHSIQPPSVTIQNAATTPQGTFPGGTGATPVGAQQAAVQILANANISLATAHASGKADNANAKQNIIDTSQGTAAQRSAYTDGSVTGPGGSIQLNSSMLSTILAAGNALPITVTEIAGGVHSAGSDPHYFGNAVDIRPQSATSATQAQLVGILRNGGATKIGLECSGGPSNGYLALTGPANDGDASCLGKGGYHIHAQW